MPNQFPSLITPDAQAGLALATRLVHELHAQFETAGGKIERPGGTNYLTPPAAPKELIGSVLFYAIAAANYGWPQSK